MSDKSPRQQPHDFQYVLHIKHTHLPHRHTSLVRFSLFTIGLHFSTLTRRTCSGSRKHTMSSNFPDSCSLHTYLGFIVKSNGSSFHRRGFMQISPSREADAHGLELAPFNGVGFHQLRTLMDRRFRDIVQLLARPQPQIDVCR